MASSGYNLLSLGLNSDNNADYGGGPNTFGGATFYIDDVTVIGTPPPVAGSYTFDTGKLGFKKFQADPEPAYSTKYGGTLAFAATNNDFHFWANKNDMTGNELAKLKACAVNGGIISYDLIAPPGYLGSRGISTVIQNQGGTGAAGQDYSWNQVDVTIPPASVQTLPDGHEVARISIPASAFTHFVAANGYDFNIAFRGFDTTPVTVYFDNLTFSPNAAGSKLTFASGVQNFEDVNGATASDSETVELDSLTNGDVLGAKAVFTSTDPDTEVVDVHTSLATAATRGGLLKLKITKAILPNRDAPFTGVIIKVGYNPTTSESAPSQQRSITIPASAFTAATNLETPTGFSQTINIPLYATGSTATDGFVLGNEADYKFFIGTEVYDTTSVKIGFDDFQVCPAADPKIIYLPALPSGSSGIVGRVLSNSDPAATFSATGLPPGVTLDASTGLLTGTPTANGTYDITFSVTKYGITDTTESVQWVVSGIIAAPVIPVITSFSITGTTAVISWSGTGATPVTVSRSTTLATGSWISISTSNTSHTCTDTSAPAGKCFYRVSVP
ncbi:MAG: putative Ig domain-containing protein [Luteolibacter sp.]